MEAAMAGSIICAVDDSESAKGVARVARELSAKLGLPLMFVRVIEAASPDDAIGAVAQRLQRLTDCGTLVDCGASWLVELGHPADRLVAVAAAEEASLIVVGSNGPRSSLLGSIPAEVSRGAPCPIVIVPRGAGQALANSRGETQFAGGIAHFSLGSRGNES
jgi:nucleotide-binding universal stress UspA family protein